MGDLIISGEKGPDCSLGTPGIWPSGSTPKYLLVMFSGIVRCGWMPPDFPATPNGPFILEQWALNPCHWRLYTDNYAIIYLNALNYTLLQIRSGAVFWFQSEVAKALEAHHTSSIVCFPDAGAGAGGEAFVDLFDYPGTAHQLMYEYGLNPDPRSRLEVHEVPDEGAYVQVRRCANIYTPMNIRIKTDATHKDQYEMFEK